MSGEASLLGPVRASTALAHERQYAIRKRFLLPGWWLLGYVAQNLSSDLALLPAQVFSREVLLGSDIPPRYFHLFCSVWTEILKLLAAGQGDLRHVDVRVDGFLRGTSSEITQQLEHLESYWALPFRASRFDAAPGSVKRKRCGRAASGSQLNFVRECAVRRGDTVVLSIDLGCSLEQFWCGTHAGNRDISSEVVSINPDVVMALGSNKSMKRLCAYLLVEFAKRFPLLCDGESTGWFGGLLGGQNLWTYHKDLRLRTNSLYEHGVLGWEDSAPRLRVRDARQRLVQGKSVGAAAEGPSVLHLVRVSQLSQRAAAIEVTMQQSLMGAKTVDISSSSSSLVPVKMPIAQTPPPLADSLFSVSPVREKRVEMPPLRKGAVAGAARTLNCVPVREVEVMFSPGPPEKERSVGRKAASGLGRAVAVEVTPPVTAAVILEEKPSLFAQSTSTLEEKPAGLGKGPVTPKRAPRKAVASKSTETIVVAELKSDPANTEREMQIRFANFYYALDEKKKLAVDRMRAHMSNEEVMQLMSCFEANCSPPRRRRS